MYMNPDICDENEL